MTERDSLLQIIAAKDAELDEMLGTINEVQSGFAQINEAAGRINVENGDAELSGTARERILENFEFIQQTMQDNRNKIAMLEEKVRTGALNSNKLKQTIALLTEQLNAQNQKVQELQAQLAEKDALIAEQGAQIVDLNENVNNLNSENARRGEKIAEQDKDLNTAWFVFGTKSELKEQKILQNGDVLRSGDFNKDYFTKIDIRVEKEIRLYSKHATLLTSHPAGSYQLVKDNEGKYTLNITDYKKFWSASKYLVIQVR